MRWFPLLSACLLLATACSPAQETPDDASTEPPECNSLAAPLRIVVMDPWGRRLPGATVTLDGQPAKPDTCIGLFPPADLCLPATDYKIRVEAPDYNSVEGQITAAGPTVSGLPFWTAATHTDAVGCSIDYLFVALDHPWFAASGPPPNLNHATFYNAGQPLYEQLAVDLAAATESVTATTWWWQSHFELSRPLPSHLEMESDERWTHTVMGILETLTDVDIKIMVARFAGDTATGMAYVNTDTALRERAYDTTDRFEVMLQGNPTPVPIFEQYEPVEHELPLAQRIRKRCPEYEELAFDDTATVLLALDNVEAASWHQKAWVIDNRIAFISGMNVKSTDWDTPLHSIFEPLRMKFLSTAEERAAVVAHEILPDLGPRKDAGIRLQGPAAADLSELLGARWELGRSTGELFAEWTSEYPQPTAAAPVAGGVMAQVVATLPEPFGQLSILETHRKAIAQAKDIIFIEDQYFRAPVLLPDLKAALAASPNLHVVVFTVQVGALDGAKQWTLYMDQEMRKAAGDRYLLLQLKSFDGEGLADGSSGPIFEPIDVHTKFLFVDGIFLTVGSANKNNRGMLYEGELNAAVVDETFVRSVRQSFLANVTGDDETDWANLSGAGISARLQGLATSNAKLETAWLEGEAVDPPTGFVYPLEFSPEYYLDVGPDAF
jgi:phosphatidylserine/phosphatidylglycerophosphate/cardiolipin synthase-like enzyme